MKVGIIRCRQTEDMCPSSGCLRVAAMGKGAFEESGPVEVVGIVSCGGCPGKNAVTRAQMLVERGAEMIALATCISKGTPIGFPCPNAQQMESAIRKKIGEEIKLSNFTHH